MSQEELLTRIEQLEAENRRLRERENDSARTLHTLIRKLPSAAAAVGVGLGVVVANEPFVRLAGYRGGRLAEEHPALGGVSLSELLPAEVCAVAEATHRTGEDTDRQDIMVDGTPYTLSTYSIRRGELAIVLLRNMADPAIQAEELASRLREASDRNIRMIQQIAFLLGEEVSANAKEIGSVIRALHRGSDTQHK